MMEQPNWMKRFLEWNRNIQIAKSEASFDGKTGLSLEKVKKKKEEYAEEFSEGCSSLKKLLCHLWDNNIETMACCVGHAYGIHYEKDTFFGRMKVSEKAAMRAEKKGKRGYHHVETFSSPYIMFKCPENYQVVAEDIKKTLAKQNLPIEFSVEWDKWERISIHNDSIGPDHEDTSDQFFDAVHTAIDQVLGIGEKEMNQETTEKAVPPLKEASKEKRSLAVLLSDAAQRRKPIETGKTPALQKESSLCR